MPTARSPRAWRCVLAAVTAGTLALACSHRSAGAPQAAPAPEETPSADTAPPPDVPDEGRLRLSPPEHPDPQRDPAQNLPEIPAGPSGGAPGSVPPTGETRDTDPAAFQACVDRELSRRGLNAFGDPPGTPAREVGDRYDYVTERYPDIGTVCSTPRW